MPQTPSRGERETNSDSTVYVYALVDPRDGEVRYIGRTSNVERRLWQHVSPSMLAKHSPRAKWIRSLLAEGKQPEMRVIEATTRDRGDAQEAHWMRHFEARGAKLTNVGPGGPPGVLSVEDINDELARLRHEIAYALRMREKYEAKARMHIERSAALQALLPHQGVSA